MTSTPKFVAVLVLACGGLLLAPPVAQAHVSADADAAAPGERTTVRFRVPNESDTADTVTLKVAFPADHPLASVAPQIMPGWDAEITTSTLDEPLDNQGSPVTEAVTEIEWTGGTIPPGQYQEFPVRIGPLPGDTDELVFKVVQTYSDGEVVRWIDEEEPGQPEPEHPAPALAIEAPEPTASEHRHDAGAGDGLARGLGGTGLVAGLAALALALTGRRRTGNADVR